MVEYINVSINRNENKKWAGHFGPGHPNMLTDQFMVIFIINFYSFIPYISDTYRYLPCIIVLFYRLTIVHCTYESTR